MVIKNSVQVASVKSEGSTDTYGGTSVCFILSIEEGEFGAGLPGQSETDPNEVRYSNGDQGKSGDFHFCQDDTGKKVLSDVVLFSSIDSLPLCADPAVRVS